MCVVVVAVGRGGGGELEPTRGDEALACPDAPLLTLMS